MPQQITLVLTPRQAAEPETYTAFAARRVGIKDTDIALARVVKRSIDARQRQVKVNLTLEVFVDREPLPAPVHFDYPNVEGRTEVVIVGSGPAGLFAALRLIELGLRPVILERGRDVSSRKRDIALINRNERIDPDSNYAFGEGGAGTFSDGNSSRAARSAAITTRRCRRWSSTAPPPRSFMRPIRTSGPTSCPTSSATSGRRSSMPAVSSVSAGGSRT